MVDLLKKLFEQRRKKITVMLLDDSKPDEDNSYKVYPNGLFGLILAISLSFCGNRGPDLYAYPAWRIIIQC